MVRVRIVIKSWNFTAIGVGGSGRGDGPILGVVGVYN